jgi:hypothetical protein
MAKRTVKIGVATYQRASDEQWTFGMMDDEVDVHADDVKRFDRLNKPFELTPETAPEAAKPEPKK